MATHVHVWKETGNDLICTECGSRKLKLVVNPSQEGLLTGVMKNGRTYTVRKHRKAYLFPDLYEKVYENLGSETAKRTCEILIQTGARINEARNVQYRDFDFGRNTLRLRIAKSKARKVGEERGSPRTIPISSDYAKKMKKFFSGDSNESIKLLSTSAFDVALKKALQKAGCQEWYMYSAHSLRKTHGNWLKILGNYGIMKIDAAEICLRLGHDMNTFLKDYGSSGVMNPEDMVRARKIMGDLYSSGW